MSDLWTFGRRPSCIARYRHGGYAAIYPVQETELINAEAGVAAVAGGAVRVEAAGEKAAENNVLAFPASNNARERLRQKSGRGAPRPGPKKPRDRD